MSKKFPSGWLPRREVLPRMSVNWPQSYFLDMS